MRFTKMQGTGNDYVYVNLFEEEIGHPDVLAQMMARQHYGICSDGLVLIGPAEDADFSMRIFNSDGSEGEMCGNACRCVGKYLYERGLTDRTELSLRTGAGIRRIWLTVADGKVTQVRVDMGAPILAPEAVPVRVPEGADSFRLPLQVGDETLTATCVSMGNPHAVIFTDDPDAVDLERLGPMIERHPAFPRHTNVEFASVAADGGHIRMRVWERGSGATLSCGTGACAALVAAVLTGRSRRDADISLPGGTIHVWWDADGHIYQSGTAEFVFDGEWLEEEEGAYAAHQ